MTNRYPLIVNSVSGSIEELPAGDNLDLTSSNIVNAGTINATVVNATTLIGEGANITGINGINVSTVPEANVVTDSAQLNITTLGILTDLTVNGPVNLGVVDNITITGGSANYVLATNGSGVLSWQAQTGGGGGSAGLQDIFLLGGM